MYTRVATLLLLFAATPPPPISAQTTPGEQSLQKGREALNKKRFGDAEDLFRQSVAERERVSATGTPALAEAIVWLELALEIKAEAWAENHTSEIQQLSQRVADMGPIAGESWQALALETYALSLDFAGRAAESKRIWEGTGILRAHQLDVLQGTEVSIENVEPVRSPMTSPKVIKKVDPDYSEEARVIKRSGTVLLQFVLDQDGKAHQFRLLHSLGFGLDEKAYQAVRRWQFEPAASREGTPVPARVTVEINYRLL